MEIKVIDKNATNEEMTEAMILDDDIAKNGYKLVGWLREINPVYEEFERMLVWQNETDATFLIASDIGNTWNLVILKDLVSVDGNISELDEYLKD